MGWAGLQGLPEVRSVFFLEAGRGPAQPGVSCHGSFLKESRVCVGIGLLLAWPGPRGQTRAAGPGQSGQARQGAARGRTAPVLSQMASLWGSVMSPLCAHSCGPP